MIASKVKSPPQKMHELYVMRRSQRNVALKKVIKQWQALQQAEKFFDTLEEFGSYGDAYVSAELHFLANWVIDDAEVKLDQTIGGLVVADKRVAEAAEADRVACEKYPEEAGKYCRMRAGRSLMNPRGLRARCDAPPDAAKTPAGKYNYGQVRDIVRNVAMNHSLGRESALDVLELDGGGVTNVSSMLPENLDNVYEACQVLLSGEGASTEAEQKPHAELVRERRVAREYQTRQQHGDPRRMGFSACGAPVAVKTSAQKKESQR
jgi:hypothetical protein